MSTSKVRWPERGRTERALSLGTSESRVTTHLPQHKDELVFECASHCSATPTVSGDSRALFGLLTSCQRPRNFHRPKALARMRREPQSRLSAAPLLQPSAKRLWTGKVSSYSQSGCSTVDDPTLGNGRKRTGSRHCGLLT